TAQALGSMAFEGGDIIRNRIEKYNIDCDYRPGGIFAAFNKTQMGHLQGQKALWESLGHQGLEMLDGEAIHKEIATDAYVGGLLDKTGAHVHPLNLLLGEVRA
ncbi:FAD-dependent oxidoreductase, partial [Oleiphilus sp. HI0079]